MFTRDSVLFAQRNERSSVANFSSKVRRPIAKIRGDKSEKDSPVGDVTENTKRLFDARQVRFQDGCQPGAFKVSKKPRSSALPPRWHPLHDTAKGLYFNNLRNSSRNNSRRNETTESRCPVSRNADVFEFLTRSVRQLSVSCFPLSRVRFWNFDSGSQTAPDNSELVSAFQRREGRR